MCVPGLPTIWLQALATIWSLIASLCVLNVWNSNNHEALAIVIWIFSGFTLCTNCIKPYSAIEWDLPLAHVRAWKHLYISGSEVAFDIMIGVAFYNGIKDVTTETALLEIGTLTGLFQEISELFMEACMFSCDRTANIYAEAEGIGFYLIIISSAVQFLAALFQGGLLIHLVSNVDGDDTFLGVGLTISIMLELGLFCVCGGGFYEAVYQPCCGGVGDGGKSPDANPEVNDTVGGSGAGGQSIEMPGMDSIETVDENVR